jgi:hypothetical protein
MITPASLTLAGITRKPPMSTIRTMKSAFFDIWAPPFMEVTENTMLVSESPVSYRS